MVVNFPLEKKVRAMSCSGWLSKGIICYLLLVFSVDKTFSKNIRDVDEEEDAIDNIKRLYDSYEESLVPPHLDLHGFRKHRQQKVLPDKIPFAVSSRDYRFHLPASYLRGEPQDDMFTDRMIELDYNYPSHGDDFLPNPPYYSPYNYGGKFHSKHVPFVDYNQDYRMLPDLNPPVGGHPPPPPAYHDVPEGLPPHAYQGMGDAPPHGQDVAPNGYHQGSQEMLTSQPESVNFYQQSNHFANPGEYLEKASKYSAPLSYDRSKGGISDFYFVATIIGCTLAIVSIIIGAGFCYYRLSKSKREAADAEYPAYGVTGPSKNVSPGAADRKLAQCAHMYHYQHQKHQMIAIEKSSSDDRHCSASDADSEEDEEVPDYTVYECPGLAPTDNMEVKNPLFSDEPTPATPAATGTETRKDTKEENAE